MQRKKKLIRDFAGLALSTGLVILTQKSDGLLLPVINGIAGNLASSFIEKAEYSKIKSLLQESDPNDLNHDLKKLIAKSVSWAVKNIELLYKKKLTDKEEIKTLKDFTKALLKEVELLDSILIEEDDDIYQDIEAATQDTNLFKLFDLQVDTFPVINKALPYPEFFREHFNANLQLCFGELLKNPNNRPAYIAYQRNIYQSLENGINSVIDQNKAILARLDNPVEKEKIIGWTQDWTSLKQEVRQQPAEQISPAFAAAWDQQLEEQAKQTQLLVDLTEQISSDVKVIKGVTKDFGKTLRENWFEKNKVLVLGAFALAALIIAGLVYSKTTAPFNMSVAVQLNEDLNLQKSYPPLSKEARLKFFLPTGVVEKEVPFSNEILLGNLESGFQGQTIKVELLDKYWTLQHDSLQIQNSAGYLTIQPNEALGKIQGRVLSRDGQQLLSQVMVRMENLQTLSDEQGQFTLEVPMELRRPQYIIRLEKTGYRAIELQYYPGSPIPARLEKE